MDSHDFSLSYKDFNAQVNMRPRRHVEPDVSKGVGLCTQ